MLVRVPACGASEVGIYRNSLNLFERPFASNAGE
jgi:hypothetical protein